MNYTMSNLKLYSIAILSFLTIVSCKKETKPKETSVEEKVNMVLV